LHASLQKIQLEKELVKGEPLTPALGRVNLCIALHAHFELVVRPVAQQQAKFVKEAGQLIDELPRSLMAGAPDLKLLPQCSQPAAGYLPAATG